MLYQSDHYENIAKSIIAPFNQLLSHQTDQLTMPSITSLIPDLTYLKWPSTASDGSKRLLLSVAPFHLAHSVPTYMFDEGPVNLNSDEGSKKVTLVEVAKRGDLGHKTLVVYHMMMGESETTACPAFSMVVDGLNGVAEHVAQRINLVIIAKAPLSAIRAYAKKRGWNDLRFLSSYGNTFNKDMGFEDPKWIENMPQGPGIIVFRYEEGEDGKDGQVSF
ncbi:Nn.00g071620.m01.CDS01 [Neocucurbitaria sp. VM-36]